MAHRSGKPAGAEEQPRRGREPCSSHGLRRADQQADVYQRLIKGGDITLFSPSDAPGLYDAFFADQDKLEELYTSSTSRIRPIRKKTLKAVDLFSLMMQERAGTGRIYIQNVDHCNTHSPFDPSVAPVRQSNLCLEIALPTKPLNDIDDESGEIALCTLSAFNLGAIEKLEDLEEMADLAVRALDTLLDYRGLPDCRRQEGQHGSSHLGIGVINYAYYLAKNGARYSDGSGLALTHRTFEAIQYYLLKASVQLAREFGPCRCLARPPMPRASCHRHLQRILDALCNEPLHLDWESLREDQSPQPACNSTLTALMPAEPTARSPTPPTASSRHAVWCRFKASKDGILKQVVPEYDRLKDRYELLWKQPER
ncbi:hypothetical protein ACLK12_12000 [Escherichia coli]